MAWVDVQAVRLKRLYKTLISNSTVFCTACLNEVRDAGWADDGLSEPWLNT
jgi:hypothetical protein